MMGEDHPNVHRSRHFSFAIPDAGLRLDRGADRDPAGEPFLAVNQVGEEDQHVAVMETGTLDLVEHLRTLIGNAVQYRFDDGSRRGEGTIQLLQGVPMSASFSEAKIRKPWLLTVRRDSASGSSPRRR